MKAKEEIIDKISKYIFWDYADHIDPESEVGKLIIDYVWQEVKKRDEQIKKLLFAATKVVKITSNEDYIETIEKAFDILDKSEFE